MLTPNRPSALAFVILTCAVVSAQDLALDQILKRNDEAMGGAEVRGRIRTMRMKLRETADGAVSEASIAVSFGRPDRIRNDITSGTSRGAFGYDGITGWTIDSEVSPEPRKLDEAVVVSLKESLDARRGPRYAYLGDVYPVVRGGSTELLGKADVKGSPAYILRNSTNSAEYSTYYIDAATFLLVRRVDRVVVGSQSADVDRSFGDYRRIEGIMIPHDVQVVVGTTRNGFTYEKIEVNVSIDDDIFRVPGRNPQAIADLERQTEDPARAKSAVPQLERALCKDIQNNFLQPKYVITDLFRYERDPSVVVLSDGKAGEKPAPIFTIKVPQTGIYSFSAESDNATLSIDAKTGFPRFPSEIGTIHRFEGVVPLMGYTFENEGDEFHRLTFAIIEDVGYVFLRGKGRVRQKDGKEVRF